MKSFDEVELFFASRRKLGIKPGLERLDYLLEKTGHPEKKIKTIHVAGTNGKGSTITYMKEVLIKSGYNVGTFVSPGLPTIRNHMMINHEIITEHLFIEILNNLLPLIREMDELDMSPSEYEILMVITLHYFLDNTDIALVETCMGGKDDVTNRVEPIVTVITTVDYDHMGFLGDSLAEIASHKAGIIKRNVPVVIGDLAEEARKVVLEKAKTETASVYQYKKDYQIKDWQMNQGSQQFTFSYKRDSPVEISMIGEHQVDNAANAMMAVQLLMEKGWSINRTALQKGFKQAMIDNRLQVIKYSPFTVIDGAHNVASIERLIETSRIYWNERNIFILFSAFRDKEISKMTELLEQISSKLVVTTFDHPRALSEGDLTNSLVFRKDYQAAYIELLQQMDQEDVLLITGSLHFVEKVKEIIER
ncbi:bifunctional folylpolyglutamate synthase/dihydrofolate synthase [Gracilibacillus xinjiangensis]|uniref:tetrahydrofolate synthase n=1 Tax=Gracilibacillus xinjiangensis TaxID=1193282 RepID=A0ABV8WZD7_9BACI